MRVTCPFCNKPLEVKNELSGTNSQCPVCNNVFQVPVPKAAVAVEEKEIQKTPKDKKTDEMKQGCFGCLVIIAIAAVIGLFSNFAGCGSGKTEPAQADMDVIKYNALNCAENFTKEKLVSPSTAKFQKIYDDAALQGAVKIASNGDYEINSWVDSQNIYGAMIRKKFYVRLRKLSDTRFQLIGDVRFENF